MSHQISKKFLVLAGILLFTPLFVDEGLTKNKGEGVKEQGPPPWAPAHGYRRKFTYYPNQGIYYDVQKKQYFWLDAGKIKVGVELPKGLRLDEKGITVELPSDMPLTKDFKK